MDGLFNGMLHGLLTECCGSTFLASDGEKVDARRIRMGMARDTVDACADLPRPKTSWVIPGGAYRLATTTIHKARGLPNTNHGFAE